MRKNIARAAIAIVAPMRVKDVAGWLWPITAAVERGLKQAKGGTR